MGRKAAQTDIEDLTAKPGHNSVLTDEEKRALTLHHKKLYEAADAIVEKAKSDRTAVADLAKADLGKGALADIKDMILAGDEAKMKKHVERTLRLARWAGMPIGSQPALFDPITTPEEDGKTAGMSGEKCEPPQNMAQESAQKWISGWHAGQTVLMSAFKKKREPDDAPVASDAPNMANTSDQPFRHAADA